MVGDREHERGLASFLRASRRERFVELLAAGGASRDKITSRLAHFEDIDPRFEHALADTHHGAVEVGAVARALRGLGSQDEVYVVSELPAVDGRFLPLEAALDLTLSQTAGSLVSCLPGRLALFEGESPGDRVILRRA